MAPYHVLVVDDEPHIARIIRARFEQGPFRVTVAESGTDALAVLNSCKELHLVILDLMLPGVSGPDVLQFLRSHNRWRHLPCIVLTAAAQDTHYRTATELGASEFMTKPFSPRRLLARALSLVSDQSEQTAESGSTP